MFRLIVLVATLVACAMATEPNPVFTVTQSCKAFVDRYEKNRDIRNSMVFDWESKFGSAFNAEWTTGDSSDPCLTVGEFKEIFCNDCEYVRKVSHEYVNGLCCPSYECRPNKDDPCCEVSCVADSQEEAEDECNIIHENNAIWNSLSPYYGAMEASLVSPADESRGKCCNQYKCSVNSFKLCENEIFNQPCPDQSTCPMCYTAQITEPVDPPNGKCCPTIECVRDDDCLCANREDKSCPMPSCNEEFEYMVVISEATADSCCPTWTCQRNLNLICQAKWEEEVWYHDGDDATAYAFTEETPELVCGNCSYVTKFKPANFAAGRCFPEWKCAPVEDRCCGVPDGENLEGDNCTVYEPDCTQQDCLSMELQRPANRNKGRCCDTYACYVDEECVCDGVDCPYTGEEMYKSFFCPDRNGQKVKQFYTVETIPAAPLAGKCCPTYICRETAQAKLKKKRLAKRAAKKAAKKQSTTTTRR